jgi:hypothetical protein
MTPEIRARLHNAPPTLSALQTSDEPAFRRACADRHAAGVDRWLRDREPPSLAGMVRRVKMAMGRK